MNDKFMTRQDSFIIKGMAILLMLIHHLFAFPERISSVSYIPMFLINNISIEYYLGVFGGICVAIFIFISGYGLYISYEKKSICKRIFKFYKNFFIIFVIFVSIGVSLQLIKPSIKTIVGNLVTVSSSINGEWWFVQLYIILLIIYPLIHKMVLKGNYIIVLLISISISLINFKFNINVENSILSTGIGIISGMFTLVARNQIYLVIGCIFAKERLFDKMSQCLIRKKLNKNRNYILIIILTIIISFINNNIKYIIVTPIFIFACINIFKNSSILALLGRHSNNIWLVHTFFCYYYFQEIIFYPKYSILILIWLCIISLCASLCIKMIIKIIDSIWNKVYTSLKSLSLRKVTIK